MQWYKKWRLEERFKGFLINSTRVLFTLLLFLMMIGYSLSIITIDLNVILIVIIISLIWFTPTAIHYLEKVEFRREGNKFDVNITFAKLKSIEENAEKANLLQSPSNLSDVERFVEIAKIHPPSALITLRTDIEQKLRKIAEVVRIDIDNPRQTSMNKLIQILTDKELLNNEEASVLNDLRGTLNHIVHSVDVSPQTIQWAINVGPLMLTALDNKIKQLSVIK